MPLQTSTLLRFRGKYCTSNSQLICWLLSRFYIFFKKSSCDDLIEYNALLEIKPYIKD